VINDCLKYKDLELYMIKNPLAHPATEANAQVYNDGFWQSCRRRISRLLWQTEGSSGFEQVMVPRI